MIPSVHPRLPRRLWLLAVVGLAAAACAPAGAPAAAPSTSQPTLPAPPAPAPPSTAAPPPTTTPPPPPPAGLGPGASGPEVEALQRALEAQKFSVGTVDGVYGQMTVHAVMAFQKTFDLPRTGRADPATLARIAEAPVALPMVPDGGATRVEIDLKRQMLQLYLDGELHKVLSASTGTGKRYCDNGRCGVAVTPGGSYRVGWRVKGIRISPLGKLWNPLFFNGGIAIHGSPSVPAGPASHGCVRIPIPDSVWFYDTVPNGTPVYVVNGNRPALPLGDGTTEPAPTTTGPAAPTTTAAPTTSTSTTSTSTTAPPATTTTTAPSP